MARIPLDPPRTLSYRLASWFSRHRYQAMLDPVAAMAGNVPAGRACGILETQEGARYVVVVYTALASSPDADARLGAFMSALRPHL